MSRSHNLAAGIAAALAISVGAFALATADDGLSVSGFDMAVDGAGSIRIPDVDFRKDWALLGAWAVAADEGTQGSQGLHVVYTQPGVIEAYRQTGEFPDGAVLIKELLSTTTAAMTTGTISRADQTSGWFVMVRDSNRRFPGNLLWGDGWGWAYFDAGDRISTTTSDYKIECKACHVPARDNDWVYVQGYPVLKGR